MNCRITLICAVAPSRPVFPADEMPIEGVSSTLIGDILKQKGHKGFDFCSDMEDVLTKVSANVNEGDVIATIGAGDRRRTGLTGLTGLSSRWAPLIAFCVQ